MIERIVVTVFPVAFLSILFGGGERFRRRHIDMDGDAPINKPLFYSSKYLILLVWLAMVLHTWGIGIFWFDPLPWLKWAAISLWVAGFVLLLLGRVELGASFRIGRPKESTHLQVGGLFCLSRNPMYLGVYTTLLAAILRTLNPLFVLVVAFIVAVHHRIVLAEEDHLRAAFGEEYAVYCRRVRRYL